jgi:hypothetical protein
MDNQISPLEIDEKTREDLSALFHGEEINGEKLPPIQIKFYSGPHGTALDAEGIKERLEEADIYIPEFDGWTEEKLEHILNVSSGKQKPSDEKPKNPLLGFEWVRDQNLYNTKKPVMIIDVPAEQMTAWIGEASHGSNKSFDQCRTFDEAKDLIDRRFAEVAEVGGKKREKYLLEQLVPKLKEMIKKQPELKQKKEIHILMTLGSAHSAIYYTLKELGGKSVLREFRYDFVGQSFQNELAERHLFGQEINEDLKERALMEMLISQYWQKALKVSYNMEKLLGFRKYIAEMFSMVDIREIFNVWNDDRENFYSIFERRLAEKGLKMPETEKELDDILFTTKYKALAILSEQNTQTNGSEKI